MYSLEEKRKRVIQFLRTYGYDNDNYKGRVVLAAPAYGAQNELRVYMNGGNVGKIALDEKTTTTGISKALYAHKHYGEIPAIVDILDKNSRCSEEEKLDAIIDDEYLQYAEEATTTYSVKSHSSSDKERTIETLIMDFHNQKCGNAAIDMEMQYSARDHFGWTREKKKDHSYLSEMVYRKKIWYNEFSFPNTEDTKSPRIDLLVLNDGGIGFVELKVDNENCSNLQSHISHMKFILSHKDRFICDAERRVNVLKKYDLLETEMNDNLGLWHETKNIWCGILFVGKRNHLSGAKTMIAQHIDSMEEDICCTFIDVEIIKKGKLNLSKDIFVTANDFVSSLYQGVFE